MPSLQAILHPWAGWKAVSRTRQVTVVALVLIVAQLAFRAWFTSRSWFYVDDFYFLSDVAQGRDNLEWYLRLHQGHFMPLSFVLVKLASLFGAYPWGAVATQILILQLTASLACWWMLRTLFGSRPMILLLLGAYLLSPLTVEAASWWAVALNQLPHQVAVFGAVATHVIYARSGRHRWAIPATAFLVLGYCTYTKTLLLPVMLGLLSLFYFASGGIGRRVLTVIRRQWFGLSLYALVSAAFLLSYAARLPPNVDQGSDFYNLASTTTLSSLGTALVGGPWAVTLYAGGPITEAAPPAYGIVAAWIILFVGLAWIWGRRERTLRALVLPVIYVGISIVIIYSGRGLALGFIGGVRVGQLLRYLGDTAPIMVLALALMLLPLRGAVESSEPREKPLISGPPPRWLVACVALVIAGGSVMSTFRINESWTSDYPERAFTQNAERTIRTESRLFAEGVVPARILPPFASPYDLISRYLAPVGDQLHITTVGNDLSLFDVEGNAIPAHVSGEPRTAKDSAAPCPYRVFGEPETIPFAPVVNFALWIGVDYRSTTEGTALLEYGSQRVSVPIESGTHTLFVRSKDAFDSITLTPLVGQRICVSSVRVGFVTDGLAP